MSKLLDLDLRLQGPVRSSGVCLKEVLRSFDLQVSPIPFMMPVTEHAAFNTNDGKNNLCRGFQIFKLLYYAQKIENGPIHGYTSVEENLFDISVHTSVLNSV